ncbi:MULTISPECIES: phage tail tube protein [unclassified Vibrio]|uniref:phage tail tube protein n=1 Tax=unclassified Vibrio TaxID=2614977 RepID=UPI000B8EA790|nr:MULTISPECIES: phage tail tube protein [unclassified Vibrio]NAX17180.1 phage tail protein [Vibrio sp. V22_P2S10T140]OXX39645.1 phage tail protein [Vibrio sp. V07_P2A8T137]OXX58194.1 phage tail protein [Vibrio sp. V10_P2A27P122]PSD40882.1 phage tail protein [Vibrio sp. V02_P2A34T13]
MAIKTQGTSLYTIDPADGTLLAVSCVTSIDGIDSALDQIETSCLEGDARTYEAGMATPGTATFGINVDPKDASHIRLHQLKTQGVTLKWAIGWSDGKGIVPTVTGAGEAAEFTLPATRSWITFEGFMNSYPFSFALNAVVSSTVGIQVSGDPVLVPKE